MFIIRKAVPEDALGIMIVNVYTWKTTYAGLIPDETIDSRIASLRKKAEKYKAEIARGTDCLVAAVGHTIVGFCMYGKSRNSDYKDSGEIFALYVLKGFQKTGVGKALFAVAVTELLAEKHDSMILNCLRGNPSLGFYLHMGGKVSGQRQDDAPGGKLTEDIVSFEGLPKISLKISAS